MTLEQPGNIGEFIGGILVLVSILYLAFQIRQNSSQLEHTIQSLRTQTSQNIVNPTNRPLLALSSFTTVF